MLNRLRRRWHIWKQTRAGVVPWHGLNLYFPTTSPIARIIVSGAAWESEIGALLANAVRPDTTVLDVGANIGASAIPLLDEFPNIKVVSFEPSPSVLPYLTRTCKESRFRDRWEIVPKAVTAMAGQEISFTVFPGIGSDVFEGIQNTGRGGEGRIIKVPTTTIDAEWEARGRPKVSLLKIDVEGAEIGVIEGAARCLRECKPAIVTEWCAQEFSCVRRDILGHD